jgi:DNA repair protein RadA/Sms
VTRAAAKPQSRYVCQSCGEAFLRWEGQCRNCGAWNSLVETVIREPRRSGPSAGGRGGLAVAESAPLASVPEPDVPRRPFGIGELDRVLGGGIVVGSIVLLGGEPGIGKSTLLLQAAAGACAAGDASVLYATGEESAAQVRLRADRLGLLDGPAGSQIRVAAESEVGRIAELARAERPTLVIVDSIQTSTVDELDGPAGSVGQVRECALRLAELAKSESIAVVLVGHVTKDGSLAGPKTLEHLVDAVLALEGERFSPLRIVRASKNRFGSTEEVGVFEMGAAGLAELDDPARAFLSGGSGSERAAPGSVVAPTLEGSRPILVEVQALVAPGPVGTPRRTASGVDPNRVALLIAVLGRRAGIGLASHDVYVNLAGGLTVEEPALDLPIAIALASSLRDRPVRAGTVAIGEVGLLGELRPVPGVERRLREAARLGFSRAIVPGGGIGGGSAGRREALDAVDGLTIVRADSLREAVEAALDAGADPASGRVAGASARC